MPALETLAFSPSSQVARQRVERGFRLPPALGNDRDSAVADLHHMLDAGHALQPWRRQSS